jgi:hypothetical protein
MLGHKNILGYHDSDHWPHMCSMKLFDSNRYGVIMANVIIGVSFDSGLRSELETFGTSQLKM